MTIIAPAPVIGFDPSMRNYEQFGKWWKSEEGGQKWKGAHGDVGGKAYSKWLAYVSENIDPKTSAAEEGDPREFRLAQLYGGREAFLKWAESNKGEIHQSNWLKEWNPTVSANPLGAMMERIKGGSSWKTGAAGSRLSGANWANQFQGDDYNWARATGADSSRVLREINDRILSSDPTVSAQAVAMFKGSDRPTKGGIYDAIMKDVGSTQIQNEILEKFGFGHAQNLPSLGSGTGGGTGTGTGSGSATTGPDWLLRGAAGGGKGSSGSVFGGADYVHALRYLTDQGKTHATAGSTIKDYLLGSSFASTGLTLGSGLKHDLTAGMAGGAGNEWSARYAYDPVSSGTTKTAQTDIADYHAWKSHGRTDAQIWDFLETKGHKSNLREGHKPGQAGGLYEMLKASQTGSTSSTTTTTGGGGGGSSSSTTHTPAPGRTGKSGTGYDATTDPTAPTSPMMSLYAKSRVTGGGAQGVRIRRSQDYSRGRTSQGTKQLNRLMINNLNFS